jgi:hypothetical protein
MFKISNICLYVLSAIMFLSLDINIALSQKPYSKEEIIKNARTMFWSAYGQRKNCFYLISIKLEEAGFITLHFKQNNFSKDKFYRYHTRYCPGQYLV